MFAWIWTSFCQIPLVIVCLAATYRFQPSYVCIQIFVWNCKLPLKCRKILKAKIISIFCADLYTCKKSSAVQKAVDHSLQQLKLHLSTDHWRWGHSEFDSQYQKRSVQWVKHMPNNSLFQYLTSFSTRMNQLSNNLILVGKYNRVIHSSRSLASAIKMCTASCPYLCFTTDHTFCHMNNRKVSQRLDVLHHPHNSPTNRAPLLPENNTFKLFGLLQNYFQELEWEKL